MKTITVSEAMTVLHFGRKLPDEVSVPLYVFYKDGSHIYSKLNMRDSDNDESLFWWNVRYLASHRSLAQKLNMSVDFSEPFLNLAYDEWVNKCVNY